MFQRAMSGSCSAMESATSAENAMSRRDMGFIVPAILQHAGRGSASRL